MFLHVSVYPQEGCLGPGPGWRLGGVAGGCLGPHPGGGWGVDRPTPKGCVSRPTPGGVSQHALRQTPPPKQTATAAGGMHPTGMHSCYCNFGATFPSLVRQKSEKNTIFFSPGNCQEICYMTRVCELSRNFVIKI